jgi:hypothetical protein
LLTTRLARVGNLEVCILADLRPIFMEARRSLTLPMEWLQHSIEAGYKLGMHVYAIVLYRSNTGGDNDDIVQRLLRELEGTNKVGPATLSWKNQTCMQFHQDVYWRLQDMVPQDVVPIIHPILRQDGHHQCTSGDCNEPVEFEEWDLWSRFCSKECRISRECYKLFTSM